MAGDLTAAFTRARAAWPGVSLELDAYVRRAAELDVAAEDVTARAEDLYLAWACAAADRAALAHFERTFLPQVDGYVGRMGLAADVVDELRQQLRIRLLTGPAPRIGQYGGRGPLGAWVRVAAIRLALTLSQQLGGRVTDDTEALDALASGHASPELSTIKKQYRDSFQTALERSLTALSAREKTILRMHFVDHLNIDAIGKIYRVHRATVARWLVGTRQRVMAQLRVELALELPASSSEFRSMVAVIQDDLSVSLQRLLD